MAALMPNKMSDDESLEHVPYTGSDSPSTLPQPSLSAKRKRELEVQPESKRAAKRKKLKNRKKNDNDEEKDVGANINTAIGRMDGRLLADYVAQRTKRFGKDLSLVQLEDRYMPERAFVDTSDWDLPRDLANLPAFLERYAGGDAKEHLAVAPKNMGTPHTIVVTAAGLRAADVTRALRRYQTKDAMVAKLFAKHVKLKDAIESIKKTRINIGVGTPQRLTDLLNDGALSSQKLQRIIVDASHIDQKKRGILDMKETQVPLVQLLTREDLKNRYGAAQNRIDLIFY